MKRLKMNPSEGFTLVELLTVIAILAILSALMLFGWKAVIVKARATKCLSNMRQTGVAFYAYCADQNGSLPVQRVDAIPQRAPDSWAEQVLPYAGSVAIMGCPEAPNDTGRYVTFMYNAYASGHDRYNTVDSVKIFTSKSPSKDMLLIDNIASGGGVVVVSQVLDTTWESRTLPLGWFTHPRAYDQAQARRSKRSILFVDGHVELRGTDLSYSNWTWPLP